MTVILIYDISSNNTEKFRKLCGQYLYWVQFSVFEGEITKSKLIELENRLKNIINKNMDSIIIYEINNSKWLKKNVLGINKNELNSII
jgi:CRISPR-associated protein Cas2